MVSLLQPNASKSCFIVIICVCPLKLFMSSRLQSQTTPPTSEGLDEEQEDRSLPRHTSNSPEPVVGTVTPPEDSEYPPTPALAHRELDETSKVKAIRRQVHRMTTAEGQAQEEVENNDVHMPDSRRVTPVEVSLVASVGDSIALSESAASKGVEDNTVPIPLSEDTPSSSSEQSFSTLTKAPDEVPIALSPSPSTPKSVSFFTDNVAYTFRLIYIQVFC